MKYGIAVRVLLILLIWGLATIVVATWSGFFLRHIKKRNVYEEVIESETVHVLVMTIILFVVVFICLHYFPETLLTIIEFTESVTGASNNTSEDKKNKINV